MKRKETMQESLPKKIAKWRASRVNIYHLFRGLVFSPQARLIVDLLVTTTGLGLGKCFILGKSRWTTITVLKVMDFVLHLEGN